VARAAAVPWAATSAGLLPEHFSVNPGPISQTVLAAARERGHTVPDPLRPPRGVTADDFAAATRVIALKESEHRAIVAARFPEWATKVEYWKVHDVDVALPRDTLPLLETAVEQLVRELAESP
jgi:protein-tyrosine phosphatase